MSVNLAEFFHQLHLHIRDLTFKRTNNLSVVTGKWLNWGFGSDYSPKVCSFCYYIRCLCVCVYVLRTYIFIHTYTRGCVYIYVYM